MSKEEVKKTTRDSSAAPIKLYLYTLQNQDTPQLIDQKSVESLKNSYFNASLATYFIIHGWTNNYQSEVNVETRTALMKHGNFNVISVDWSEDSQTINYIWSRNRVEDVGKQVASFIDFAYEFVDLSFDTLELIGHSLGAHCAGHAGKSVKNGIISRIVGLDPALPLFDIHRPAERLAGTDAEYVEIVHTNGGLLGFLEPIGIADFYPNEGQHQPGCGLDIAGICSHYRSFKFYAESKVNNRFSSFRCANYEAATDGKCATTSSVKLGDQSNNNSTGGIYYLSTNSQSPYGKGV